MKDFLKKCNPVDVIIISYCIVTGIIIILAHNKLQNSSIHLLIRLLILFVSLSFISLSDLDHKIMRFIRHFYPLLFLGFFYSETDYYNNLLFDNFDPLLVHIEQIVFGLQPALKFSNLLNFRWFSELMHFGYFSYYLIVFAVPLIFYLKDQTEFKRVLFITVFSFCIYYLIFILFPSVGPQFYFSTQEALVPKGFVFYEIMQIIIHHAETETGAFPSSHVGMTILFLILIWNKQRKYFILLLTVSIILIVSTVYLKAHYVIDVIAGVISGVILYWVSSNVYLMISKNK